MDAMDSPSSVKTTGPALKIILPCWNKALPVNVNIKKIEMGIHPLIRDFRGILKKSIGIAAKMTK